jgi:hypothetical protein
MKKKLTPPSSHSENIAQLNDRFRDTMSGGLVLMTSGIRALPRETQTEILDQVRTFEAFTPDNDPYGEHDFGTLIHQDLRIFWKIDYYDPSLVHGSSDPGDPQQTRRVLTVMLAEEY